MTPSLVTCLIASATNSPISGSLLAEMVAICCISLSDIGVATFLIKSIILVTDKSIALLISIGGTPAAICLIPSATIAWVNITLVLVPSPASFPVLFATDLTN